MVFNIKMRFGDGLTNAQEDVFGQAADRWSKVITGDLPSAEIDGEKIDDLMITASGTTIDGSGLVLGHAGPDFVRTDGLLPITGLMEFDIDDLADMEADGSLIHVIIHEMGHVIGLGTIWEDLGLLAGAGTDNPEFTGQRAMEAYATLLQQDEPQRVPVANTGGPGTADGHWREATFGNELMTGFVDSGANPLSILTIAALEDMGYVVDHDAADEFIFPPLGLESLVGGRRCGMKSPVWKTV